MPMAIRHDGYSGRSHAEDMEGIIMGRFKLIAVCVGLFSVMMTGIGAELEYETIKNIVKSHRHSFGPYMGQATTDDPALEKKINIIRDQFRMFLIFGGAFGGSVVCVMLRIAFAMAAKQPVPNRFMLSAFFVVSLLSSIFCTPSLLKYYHVFEAEECFSGPFILAAIVYVLWEIAFIIGNRIKQAAIDRGWAGVVGEIKGNTAVVTANPTPPAPPARTPTPALPVKVPKTK